MFTSATFVFASHTWIYTEVWLDEGVVNMFAVMKDWCARNQYPGGGGFAAEIYNVGYAKAMLQAALSS
jgi:hypothetical protein